MPSTSFLTRVLIKGESGWSELREVDRQLKQIVMCYSQPQVVVAIAPGVGQVIDSGSRSGP